MPICPYCSFTTITRRQHVNHLQTQHPSAHAYNIHRSRGAVTSIITPGVCVPDNTAIGPVQSQSVCTSSDSLPSHPWTVHCAVCIPYESGWVQVCTPMEQKLACHSNSRYCSEYCTNVTEHNPTDLRLYCPRGVCRYPHPLDCGDDRINDWGGRGRINNVYCRGHIPKLCPMDPLWLKSHFLQASLDPPFSTRLEQQHYTAFEPVMVDDFFKLKTKV